ncbi:FMN-dependent oxidoreductase, nitrilotriacetate monooxygenase family [Rhodococcus rhodochrous J3]|uniref:FMN-dependent oxidoreductase, nitrilotriacetate monooxygenase family n=1 Tax=Rhodococcus rhodochrous J3 TaxID=903528 RepID=A0ABY1MD06_RHORH|nr:MULTISPECIES: NtaA/DmoA family FMN-dependent monooxygenase [Rhodococcus]MBF4481135.1 NtaA/DmoA family FMN-dependent monooxygenase [Rhodococcus rhodochrous]MDC3728510.1 NtaA/DmoA family FMN-dependent monooxygenase [Rhodococcus sp. Rp3]WSE24190.1 NtaA/DmoA family FMN-dependent monooxygenase [Rhodococcus sp. PD04]SMG45196.1 FMN-dependent oxidoreductase, nitrilotriacetate monooxygenase family [Rhodococcus rhodochrous J3]
MFHMGWFLSTGFGVYDWKGPWSGNIRADIGNPELFLETAAALERAGFDYMMLEDSSVLPDIYQGSYAHSLKNAVVRYDPLPLVSLIARHTEHIGVIATMATSFYPPFLAARLMSSLDHLTHGRVGVNLVTASPHAAAQNYGLDEHIEHDLRYAMADEWMQVVSRLWESWEPDALGTDENRTVYVDHTRVHPIHYEGRFHRSRGPLNTLPGPQRRPVVCQAGGSPAGRELAAEHADTIVSAVVGVEAMRAYREDISARMVAHGRDPHDVKVLFLVDPILAESNAEAQAIAQRRREAAASDVEGALAGMSYVSGLDFSQFDLDAPFPEVLSRTNGHQSTVADYQKAGEDKTLREVALTRSVKDSIPLVGTPASVADQMAEAMEYAGGDGFLIASAVTRRNVSAIADGLAPELRRRDLIRSSYDYGTFRENLLSF